jgi:two-component system, response regulator PdtaR
MRRYLIVDDNAAFAENLAEILADAGAEAVVAPSGERAIELVKTARFDALLCDMRMPGMGGAEVVHRVRRLDPGLPAIVVTAYTTDDDLVAAWREGLLAVLPKPVPVAQLVQLLAAARRDGLVAIVEDDAQLADNMSEILRARGFAAVTARSVVETERLGGIAPFVALVDLRVPGGPDGAAMQRLVDQFPSLPILIVTAHADSRPPLSARAQFIKPFDSGALLDEIEKVYASRGG